MTRPLISRCPFSPTSAHTSTGGAIGLAHPIMGLVGKKSAGWREGSGCLRGRLDVATSEESVSAIDPNRFGQLGHVTAPIARPVT